VSLATAGWRDAAHRAGLGKDEIRLMEPAFCHEAAEQAAEVRVAIGAR